MIPQSLNTNKTRSSLFACRCTSSSRAAFCCQTRKPGYLFVHQLVQSEEGSSRPAGACTLASPRIFSLGSGCQIYNRIWPTLDDQQKAPCTMIGSRDGSLTRKACCLQIPKSFQIPSTLSFTALSIPIGLPHSRLVSPGHLLVASSPIFPPNPETGLAKSR